MFAPPCFTFSFDGFSKKAEKKAEKTLPTEFVISVMGDYYSGMPIMFYVWLKGKTSLCHSFTRIPDPRCDARGAWRDDWDPTIEDGEPTKRELDLKGKKYQFFLRDTPAAGCEYYVPPLVVSPRFHGYIIAYNICRAHTFANVKRHRMLVRYSSNLQSYKSEQKQKWVPYSLLDVLLIGQQADKVTSEK